MELYWSFYPIPTLSSFNQMDPTRDLKEHVSGEVSTYIQDHLKIMEHILHVSTWTLPLPIETKQHPNISTPQQLTSEDFLAQPSCFICHKTHVTQKNMFNVDVFVFQVKPTTSSDKSKWLNPNALFPSCSSWATPRAPETIGKFGRELCSNEDVVGVSIDSFREFSEGFFSQKGFFLRKEKHAVNTITNCRPVAIADLR